MSNQKLELILELKAKIDEFARNVDTAAAGFTAALNKMEAESDSASSEVEASTGEMAADLKKVGSSADKAGDEIKAAMEELGIKRHAEIQAQIESVRKAYDTLAKSGELSGKELAQANSLMQQKIKELQRTTGDWLGSLSKMKMELAAAGIAVGGLARVVDSAAEASKKFQNDMAEVSTLLSDTSAIKGLTEDVEKLSLAYGKDVGEEAKALYQVISAGAEDSAEAVDTLTTANKLAIGGVTDIKNAADGLTTSLNAYGDKAGSATDVSDAMFVAMRAGKTTIGELSAEIGKVAPLSAQAGVSLDEMLSATAALTKGGVSTAESMTQLRAIIATVLKPTKQAADLAGSLGLQFDATALKSKGLAGFLADVKEKTGGNVEQMAALFERVEALNAALALTGNGAEDFNRILDQMEDKAGETEKAFNAMSESPAFASNRFDQALKALHRSLGDAVTALTPFLEAGTDALNLFNSMPGPVKSTALAVGTLATTTAILYKPLKDLSSVAKEAKEALKDKLPVLKSLTKELLGVSERTLEFGGTLSRLAPELALITAALAAAYFGGKALGDLFGSMSAEAKDLADSQERLKKVLNDWNAQTKSAIFMLGDYKNAVKLTAEEVALLSEEELARYKKSIDGLEKLQRLQLSNAKAEEAYGKDTKARQAELRAKLKETEAAYKDLEKGTNLAAEAMARGITPQAMVLALELGRVIDQGKTAKEALAAVGKRFNPESVDSVREIGQALEELKRTGKLTAVDVKRTWADMLSGLSTEELTNFTVVWKAAFGEMEDAAESSAAAMQTAVEAALKKLGVDAQEVTSGVSKSARDAVEQVGVVVENIDAMGLSTKEAAKVVAASLQEAFSRAKTPQDVEYLRQTLKNMGDQGILTTDALAKGMELAGQRVGELANAADKAKAPVKELKKELKETGEEGAEAFDKTAEAVGRVKESAKLIDVEMAKLTDSVKTLSEEAAKAMDDMVAEQAKLNQHGMATKNDILLAAAQVKSAYADEKASVEELTAALTDNHSATEKNIARAEEALQTYRFLGQEDLNTLRNALADAKRRTEELRGEAADTLAALQDELDQVNRNEAAIEERRYQKRREEIEAKYQEAVRLKDQKAISDLNASLDLATQIHNAKMRQIDEELAARQSITDRETADGKTIREHASTDAQTMKTVAKGYKDPRYNKTSNQSDSSDPQLRDVRQPSEQEVVKTVKVVMEDGKGGEAVGYYSEGDADRLISMLRAQGQRAFIGQ